MQINIKWIKTEFNYGIGAYPVSMYVCLGGNIKYVTLNELYKTIEKSKIPDIIFCGDIYNNTEVLNWLTTRLVSEQYHVSIAFDSNKVIPDLVANKYITHIKSLKDIKLLARQQIVTNPPFINLTQNDIIILDTNDIKEIIKLRAFFINNQIKARIMFVNGWSDAEICRAVLEAQIYDIDPYLSEINLCI